MGPRYAPPARAESPGVDEMRGAPPGYFRDGMLHLRVFGATSLMERAAERVGSLPGAVHVTRTDAGDGLGRALVTADVDPGAADAALGALHDLGVPDEDIWLLRLDGLQPGRWGGRREGGAVVWADPLGQA